MEHVYNIHKFWLSSYKNIIKQMEKLPYLFLLSLIFIQVSKPILSVFYFIAILMLLCHTLLKLLIFRDYSHSPSLSTCIM